MIPAEFDYVAPESLAEALQVISERSGDAKILAGGHSLVPLMKLRLAEPAILVDIGRIAELRGIDVSGEQVRVGALTTHAELASSPQVQQLVPALAQAAHEIGDRQVRARGTIGGSLAHNDPAADLPAVMLALDAEVVVRSVRGERTLQAGDFLIDMLATALEPDEILTEIRFAPAPRSVYLKFPNPASHYAIAGIGAALEGNGTISAAHIGVTGAAPLAYRASAAEAALVGSALTADSIGKASEAAYDGRELLSDIHASAEYRGHLIRVLTRRALEQLDT